MCRRNVLTGCIMIAAGIGCLVSALFPGAFLQVLIGAVFAGIGFFLLYSRK